MGILVRGGSLIKHAESNAVYLIEGESLVWQSELVSSRDRGVEVVHLAVEQHFALGTIVWAIWEYPSGILDDRQISVGRHKVLKDFEVGFTSHRQRERERDIERDVGASVFHRANGST